MTKMIEGCGKDTDCGFACGDSIETDYDFETGTQYCQPIYCNECWDKFNKLRGVK